MLDVANMIGASANSISGSDELENRALRLDRAVFGGV
jgi:hypothetical protein